MINEGKQVGIIYHYTTLDALHKMSKHGFTMQSQNRETISFSRNSNMWREPYNEITKIGKPGDLNNHRSVRIAVDGNKLSQNHKIKPVSGLRDNEKHVLDLKHNSARLADGRSARINRKEGESEEAMFHQDVDIEPYIKQIDTIMHRDHGDFYNTHIKPHLDKRGIHHNYNDIRNTKYVREDLRDWDDFNDNTIYILGVHGL